MKKIRILFANFYNGFDPDSFPITEILRKHFDVDIVSQNPDFVIASTFGNPRHSLIYDVPRLQWCHEPVLTDFTLFDYACGFANLSLKDKNGFDRYFRWPVAFGNFSSCRQIQVPLSKQEALKIWRGKDTFCNFMYSHQSVGRIREELLEDLASYKKVDCAGRYLNNMPNHKVYWKDKYDFQRRCRFTIAGESIMYPDFVTEKITDAFYMNTIPIYIGDKSVKDIFNPEAFIFASDYSSREELLAKVKEIDEDEDKASSILAAAKYKRVGAFDEFENAFEKWLISIFSQNPLEAHRRPRYFSAANYEEYIKNNGSAKSFIKKLLKKD